MSTHAPAALPERGSQKMLKGLANNGQVPALDEIKKAFGLESIPGLSIPNWFIKGRPADFFELNGTIQVPVASLGQVVDRLVKLNDSTLNFRIFIHGIIAPEIATLNLKNTP